MATNRPEEISERYGAPLVLPRRSEIVQALHGALPPGTVTFGTGLRTVEQTGDGIRAVFAGGRTATADMLVGADGLHSTVRATLMGAEPPRYAGLMAYRAVIEHQAGGLAGECWGEPGGFRDRAALRRRDVLVRHPARRQPAGRADGDERGGRCRRASPVGPIRSPI